MRGSSPFTVASDGVRVRVRVAPRASANRLAGLVAEADGGVALKIMVTVVAEDGKANEAVLALLARNWRLAKSDLTIVSGTTSRRKIVHVAGAAPRLLPILSASIANFVERDDAPPDSDAGRNTRSTTR